jgi:hypothetical protein
MDKHDRDNLEFLLSLERENFQEWYDSITEDDQLYAQEIIAQAALELQEQAEAMVIEGRLAKMKRFALAERVIEMVK